MTRASKPPRPAHEGGGRGGAHKELLGLPVWMWVAGVGVVIVGYLYLKSHQKPTSGQGQGSGHGQVFAVGSPTGLSYEQLLLILKDWQQGHGHGHGGGGHHHKHITNSGGPERRWLIRKTGSQHPWTYLAQHHERIVVGPHGTRTIKKAGH